MPLSRLAVMNAKNGADYLLLTKAISYAQSGMELVLASWGRGGQGTNRLDNLITAWDGFSDTPDPGFVRSISVSGIQMRDGVQYVIAGVTVNESNISPVQLEIWLVE